MFVSPILHCRTYQVDFRSNFLYAPNDFNPQKISWAKEFILNSTYMMEMAEGIRRVIFSDPEHIIVGITTTIDLLYELCGRVNQKKYHRDIGGRYLYGFIGFAIQRSSLGEPFEIPLQVYLDTYELYIKNRWNEDLSNEETVQKTGLCDYQPKDFTPPTLNNKNTFSQLSLYPRYSNSLFWCKSSAKVDEDLISIVLDEILKRDAQLSACTNLPNKEHAMNSRFLIASGKNADENAWIVRHPDQNHTPNRPGGYVPETTPHPLSRTGENTGRFSSMKGEKNGGYRDIDVLNNIYNKSIPVKQSGPDSKERQHDRVIFETIRNIFQMASLKLFPAKKVSLSETDLKTIIHEMCNQCPYRNSRNE